MGAKCGFYGLYLCMQFVPITSCFANLFVFQFDFAMECTGGSMIWINHCYSVGTRSPKWFDTIAALLRFGVDAQMCDWSLSSCLCVVIFACSILCDGVSTYFNRFNYLWGRRCPVRFCAFRSKK